MLQVEVHEDSKNLIREAKEEDIPRIVDLGSRSLKDGPYRDLIADKPEFVTETARKLLQAGKILVWDIGTGVLAGVVAFIVAPHPLSGEMTASEIIWYVIPEARNSFVAIAMMRAAQRTAREMGAKKMQFSAPNPEIGKAYESMGYRPIETNYVRAL